jgi:ubiquitin-like 1-activating enzyme E1 A
MDELTALEAKLYDRQIRLWGAGAQRRMKQATVMLINMTAVNVEACKNLVLAGVSVTIVDSAVVAIEDVGANFFAAAADVGQPRAEVCASKARELNPFATVTVLGDVDLSSLSTSAGIATLQAHTVVCAALSSRAERVALDDACRAQKVPLLCAEVHGMVGSIFVDAGAAHDCVVTKPGGEVAKDGKRTLAHPTLREAHAVSWDAAHRSAGRYGVPPAWFALELQAHLGESSAADPDEAWARALGVASERGLDLSAAAAEGLAVAVRASFDALRQCWRQEVAPVCAVIGGVLGQEVIKIISATNEPVSNYFVYDAWRGVSCLLCTVTFYANLAHSLTRSP